MLIRLLVHEYLHIPWYLYMYGQACCVYSSAVQSVEGCKQAGQAIAILHAVWSDCRAVRMVAVAVVAVIGMLCRIQA